ncbi:hypothetical protein CALCODRAFT_11081 [Calocera cornea HHB12733]|uniref:Uncharacterized protein n=1 Tax=Calocera cornea HHB12733 TaxID=1353952 RepID=A0A165J742_9BASI|nr:hypothetical protein CALCODRAFT_11081 [Calocera cornea HHB12733]
MVQDDPEMPSVAPVEKPSSKEKRRRLICEVVIEVPAKKSKKGEQLNANRTPQAKKNIPAAGLGSEDRVADEEEKRKAVAIEDTLDNEDTPPTNITNTPRASAFLDRLVQASTPARRSPRRSPVNSLGFPAQLQRTHSASSGTPSTSTPRRFQDALAQAVTTPPAASQEEITEYSQPLPPTSSSLRKILNSPIARTPSGKTLRPLSKLPRPSLTKTPGMQTTSPSPTGPPVPSPKKTIAPNIRAPTARQPTISPSLGRASLTPRASPLPTWTPLPQDSSPNPSGVDHGPSQVDQLRSSSTGLVEEISRPNSAVTRDEEMEVERATQEDRYDDEDDNDAPLDAELEDITTDERTRADEDGSDREDDVLPAIETPKLSVLGPPAQITGTGDDLIGPDAIAAYSLLDLSNAHVSSKSLSPKRASPRADNHSGKSSQLSKGPSDSSLVSYPSIPTPKPASQPLFRPDTQMPSQFQPLRMQDEETSIFSMASQYVGLSALSKDKLRESMSRAASSSQAKSTAAATNRNSAKRKEPESETEEEEEDDDDSDLEESILPRDRMAGANKARRGRAAAKFF